MGGRFYAVLKRRSSTGSSSFVILSEDYDGVESGPRTTFENPHFSQEKREMGHPTGIREQGSVRRIRMLHSG
jgi:hypothetical protein